MLAKADPNPPPQTSSLRRWEPTASAATTPTFTTTTYGLASSFYAIATSTTFIHARRFGIRATNYLLPAL